MENLKEIKLMMERLESPRLTDTELQIKKSLLKEEDEEITQDPDQLDLISFKFFIFLFYFVYCLLKTMIGMKLYHNLKTLE